MDKLYQDAGAFTRKCLDSLLEDDYTFLDDENETDYLHEYPYKNFADGLTESIIAHDFAGDPNSLDEKIAFILSKCEEKGIAIHRGNIRNWFTDKRPISGSRSRELVYLLCFALDFTIDDVTDFFLKVYFECPFNFRDYKECVYFYCFSSSLSYKDALRLIEKAEHILENHNPDEPVSEYTHMIGTALKKIHTDDDLLVYIEKNSHEFYQNNRTAYRYAVKLLDESTELALKMYLLDNAGIEAKKISRKQNIDLLLFQLFGADIMKNSGEKSFAKASDLPELVKSNFPLKMQLSNIKNGKSVSYESMRKALILLNFYRFFASLFYKNRNEKMFCSLEDDFRDFVYETDDLLYSCGYPKLYIRNPYDWLIMHCAFNEYPLDEFKNAISRYYIDIITVDF